ncbi:unnamed protein product [Dovyalis caffra]|uniref:Uncharacterized protein n=1 Tax=Dovyalis caffra TaxID=77055 RepID=A0AAV1QSP5_9ROSI|nr:unnamed protein product [Dovyalis caffra]
MHSLLPSLQQLKLRRLPQLDSVPNGRLPSKLKSLLIHDSIKLNALSPSLQSLLSLSSFSFCGDDDVESFPGETLLLPSALTFLRINRLRKLKYLDYKGLQHLTSLRDVMICECPELELIPEESLPSSTEDLILGLKDLDYKGLKHLTSLRQLKIWNQDYNGLQHLTSLRSLKIDLCSDLEFIPEESLSSSIESLDLKDLDYKVLPIPEESLPSSLELLEIRNLKSLNSKGLQHLTSLRELKICGCPMLESMTEEGLPSSLESLEITNLKNLKSLQGLQHLNSICNLDIWNCQKLESMPEEGLPSSLTCLRIFDCPSLVKRVSSISPRSFHNHAAAASITSSLLLVIMKYNQHSPTSFQQQKRGRLAQDFSHPLYNLKNVLMLRRAFSFNWPPPGPPQLAMELVNMGKSLICNLVAIKRGFIYFCKAAEAVQP